MTKIQITDDEGNITEYKGDPDKYNNWKIRVRLKGTTRWSEYFPLPGHADDPAYQNTTADVLYQVSKEILGRNPISAKED